MKTTAGSSAPAFDWRDGLTFLGLLVFALRPVLPAPNVVLGLTGAILLLSVLAAPARALRFSRAAAAITAGLCLYFGLAGEWRVWPAYLLVPLAGAALLAAVIFAMLASTM